MRFRDLDPVRDRPSIEQLWTESLPTWPVLPRGVDMLKEGLVAEENERVIGLAARDGGALQLLMVAPDHRKRHIGSDLFDAALAAARAEGRQRLSLGSGGKAYVWPGVPIEASDAVAFFERLGYRWNYTAIDLIAEMQDWEPRATTVEIARSAGVAVSAPASDEEIGQLLSFERTHFPKWLRHFESREGLLLSRRDAEVVGSLIWRSSGSVYEPALRSPCGSIGCVGVRPDQEGRGIATAMLLEATRLVRDRGAAVCHIGWAWRTGLYERAGYQQWRAYLMSDGNS